MKSRSTKAAYYAATRVPMRINGLVYRYLRQPREPISVHLGPGQHRERQLQGWVSLDANIVTARPDVWANLLDPLPFRDNSVRRFYSYHTIEHLPESHLATHFRELHRCLVPGGGIRVGAPDAENSARQLLAGNADWFSDFPDTHRSVGGRFANHLLCRGEHLALLTSSYLAELASDAGFGNISFPLVTKESAVAPEVLTTEEESDIACPHSVMIEAYKLR